MKPKFSIQDSVRFNRSKLPPREERRARMLSQAGIMRARLKLSGQEVDHYTTPQLVRMYHRELKIPMSERTQERFKEQGRAATLKTLGVST